MGNKAVLLYKNIARLLISRTTMHVEAGNNTNLKVTLMTHVTYIIQPLHGRLQSSLAV